MNTNENDRYLDEVAVQLSNINDPEDENVASIIEEYERQLAPLQEERDNLASLVVELRSVLELCRHELVTLDNLTASDGLKAFGEALDDGCDANGAWDCYVEETWKIDTTKAVAEIDAALATDAGQTKGEKGE